MNAFFGRQSPTSPSSSNAHEQASNNNRHDDSHQHNNTENPVLSFLRRSLGGQSTTNDNTAGGGVGGVMDAATEAAAAAAAHLGGFMNDHFYQQEFLAQQFAQAQAYAAQHQQQQQQATGPPPASAAALRQLPTISVTAEDLVEPSNRECCICFDDNNIGDRVVRLPCAHIYHSHCITDWLTRHCTCPTCRYELPTDDPMYEAGRRERMRTRKPRYAKYELERMSIRELKALLPRRMSSALFSDKADLMEFLVEKEIVDLISTPPPVEFPSLAVLRAMGVGQLKRTMNETGVYFSPKDVVEKEDMVQIFLNSGRINILEPDLPEGDNNDDNGGGPDTTYGHAPCDPNRQRGYSMDMTDEDIDDENSENETNATERNNPRDSDENVPSVRSPIVVETVRENEDDVNNNSPDERSNDDDGSNNSPRAEPWDSSVVMEETAFEVQDTEGNPTITVTGATETNYSSAAVATTTSTTTSEDQPARAATREPVRMRATGTEDEPDNDAMSISSNDNNSKSASDDNDNVDRASSSGQENEEISGMDGSSSQRKRRREENLQQEPDDDDEAFERIPFQNLSISELKSLARERGVCLSGCIERSEIVDRLSSSGSSVSNDDSTSQQNDDGASACDNNHGDSMPSSEAVSVETLRQWSVSHLRACANAMDVDISQGSGHEDMVQALLAAALERPHVSRYLTALSPLMNMSTSQLRALAREWNVRVSDCLEKGEMIRRLAASAAEQSSTR